MAAQTNESLNGKRKQLLKDISDAENQKKLILGEIKVLQVKVRALHDKIGNDDKDGTLQHQCHLLEQKISKLEPLKQQVEDYTTQRNALLKEIGHSAEPSQILTGSLLWKKQNIENQIKQLDISYKNQEAEINKKLNIINNVKDFKTEAVTNMRIYKVGMIVTIIILIILICLAKNTIIDTIRLFREQQAIISANRLLFKSTDLIMSSISIILIKTPITILFLGGMFLCYKLFSSLFKVYEKINNEKRKISTIEAIINHLNEKSVAIISGEEIDFGDIDSVKLARDKIKWESISKYFESLPADNLENDQVLKSENDLLRNIFLSKRKKIKLETPAGSADISD